MRRPLPSWGPRGSLRRGRLVSAAALLADVAEGLRAQGQGSAASHLGEEQERALLRDVATIAAEVASKLTRSGAPGMFAVTPGAAADILVWHGARRDQNEAEQALVATLAGDGYESERLLGLGVRIMRGSPRNARADAAAGVA